MDHNLHSYFTHSWNVNDACHKAMFSLNDSMSMLQMKMHDPTSPYHGVPNHEDFIT